MQFVVALWHAACREIPPTLSPSLSQSISPSLCVGIEHRLAQTDYSTVFRSAYLIDMYVYAYTRPISVLTRRSNQPLALATNMNNFVGNTRF